MLNTFYLAALLAAFAVLAILAVRALRFKRPVVRWAGASLAGLAAITCLAPAVLMAAGLSKSRSRRAPSAHYQGQRHASANSAWTIDRVWFLRRLSFEHRHDDGRSGSWRASAGPDWPLHSSQPDAGGSIETLVGWPNLSAIRNSNIISGLVIPSEGRLLFDDIDVTHLPTKERNIAQVFKFPVIYDTKTVAENLAFPLKNRRLPKAAIERRVTEIAAMLDLTGVLNRRARGLTADAKQKISSGRGLVRSDVSAVLFDEPLTVIDPALKWELQAEAEGCPSGARSPDDLCDARSH